MLRPTIIFTVIISTIGGLQLFTEPLLFQPSQAGRHRRLRRASTRRSRCTCTRRPSAAASSSSATPRRSPGSCSCSSRRSALDQLPARAPDPVGGLADGRAVADPRRPTRRRAQHGASAGFGAAGPLTYVVLVAGRARARSSRSTGRSSSRRTTTRAIGAYPPVLTPGGQLCHNIGAAVQLGRGQRRLLDGARELVHRRDGRSRSRWCSSARWPASRSPSCASAAARAAAGRDRDHDDGADAARA